MDEMVRYIFGTIRMTELQMKKVAKILSKQRTFNNGIVVIAALSWVEMTLLSTVVKAQDKEIEKLKKELAEVKSTMKGE